MSFDLKLNNLCPHKLYEDIHKLEEDRKTIHLNRVPANYKNLVLKINGTIIEKDNPVWGYVLVNDELFTDRKEISLNKEANDINPLIEISYDVRQKDCPRCGGFGSEYNPVLETDGNYFNIKEERLLSQEIEKWELTIKGSNSFQPQIGTSFLSLIGTKGLSLDSIRMIIQNDLKNMEQQIMLIQRRQTTYQNMTYREILKSMDFVEVKFNDQDSRMVDVKVFFTTVDGTKSYIDKTIPIKDPSSSLLSELAKNKGLVR